MNLWPILSNWMKTQGYLLHENLEICWGFLNFLMLARILAHKEELSTHSFRASPRLTEKNATMGNVSYRTWEKEQVGDDADDYGARSKNIVSCSSQDSISECACALAGGSRDPVVYIHPRNATLRLAVCWLRISTPSPPARPDPPWTFLSPSPFFWTSSRANSSSRSWWCAPPCLHGPSCFTATTATFFNE